MQQFSHSFASDRRDNAELSKMRPDRIDHRGLLADEQMAGAVKHQAALLLRRLRRYETHVGSGDCLADSLCVSPPRPVVRRCGRAAREASGERRPVVQGLQRRCTARRSESKWWQWLYRSWFPYQYAGMDLETTAYGSDLADMCIHVD